MKGSEAQQVKILHHPSSPAGYRLEAGKQYILFLIRRDEERYVALQAYRGVVRIEGDAVSVSMLNEKGRQKKQKFIERVERTANKYRCTGLREMPRTLA